MTAPYTAYPAPSPACGVPTYDLASPRRGFWFGGTRGLYMTRDRSDNVWLSLDSDSLPAHLLDSHHAAMDWDYGVEMYFGRAFDCGRSALEARYWNINSEDYEASALRTAAVGDFNTPVDYTPLVFDNGGGGGPEPVANYLLNAEIHRVRRSYDFQNIEFNFLRLIGCGSTCQMDYCGPTCATNACGGCAGCGGYGSGGCGVAATSPWQMRWVLGMRYFRFEENFHFSTDRGNLIWGDDPLSEVFYEIDVANHLLGGQLGCRVDYATCGRVAFHGDTKLGIYSNYIRHRQFFGCDTPATIDDPGGPFHGSAYDITSTKQDLSMVAELDFGVDIAVNSCWSAGFGYRVVGATGVALTTAQIPHYFQDLGEARRIDSSGSLLLHGAYLQAEYVR